MQRIIFVVLFISLFITFGSAGIQRYAVKGKLLCGTSPVAGVKVKLVDLDFGADDELDSKTSERDGSFSLDGSEDEATKIDPVLKVYHNCDDNLPGKRRLKMTLPEKYIKEGGGTPEILDVGILNLEVVHSSEDRDFI